MCLSVCVLCERDRVSSLNILQICQQHMLQCGILLAYDCAGALPFKLTESCIKPPDLKFSNTLFYLLSMKGFAFVSVK